MTGREERAQRHEQAIAQLHEARAAMEARTKDDEVRSLQAVSASREAGLKAQAAALRDQLAAMTAERDAERADRQRIERDLAEQALRRQEAEHERDELRDQQGRR